MLTNEYNEELTQKIASSIVASPKNYKAFIPKWNKYIPHLPHPKQLAFLLAPHTEVLFGGAAGGGKTDAILMAALQYVDVPNYSALILRKSYAQLSLPNAVMSRAQSWLYGTDAHWNDKNKTFTFPTGSTLTFGFLDKPNDINRYHGSECHFIGYDELTQFTEEHYREMFSRLRRPKTKHDSINIPLRVRATTNPGGVGNAWVKARFIDNKDAGSRLFIPALITDNPALDYEEYKKSLEVVSPERQRQLLYGDWENSAQGLYYPDLAKEWPEGCVVNVEREIDGKLFGGIDWGYTGPACFLIGVYDGHSIWIIYERYMRGKTLSEHIDALPKNPNITWYADPAMPEHISRMRQSGFVVRAANNHVSPGIEQVSEMISARKLKICRSCVNLIEESKIYRRKTIIQENSTNLRNEKISEGPVKVDDHAMDAMRYLVCGTIKALGIKHTFKTQDEVPITLESSKPANKKVFYLDPETEHMWRRYS